MPDIEIANNVWVQVPTKFMTVGEWGVQGLSNKLNTGSERKVLKWDRGSKLLNGCILGECMEDPNP